jgi:TRAP transporter TAXI family solute receptor
MVFLEKFEKHFRWIAIIISLLLLAAAIFIIASSLPPRRFTLLTGREGGGYYQAAQEYQKIAAENGFTIDIRPTSGSVEVLELLQQGEAGIGFVQGGIAIDADPTELSTLSSVFYEPVWIFYNRDLEQDGEPLIHLYQLEGLRVAVGEEGSGAQRLSNLLLNENDISESNTTLLPIPSSEAAEGLLDGSIDAAFFVVAPSSETIQSLLREPGLRLMNVERADAYRSLFPFLTSVVLPEGAIDVRAGIPEADTRLISTVANLIVRNDFHPDLIRLMTIAVVETHGGGGLFEDRFEFPNFQYADLPIGKEELAYVERIKSGESTLDNYLPFWAAALIDRYLLFVLPIAILLLPAISRSPVLISLYNRGKITRWYGTVRSMDRNVPNMDVQQIDDALASLGQIETELQEKVSVSAAYMADYYDLRGHIDLVQDRLNKRRASLMRATEKTGTDSLLVATETSFQDKQ